MSTVNLDQHHAIAHARSLGYKVYRGRPDRLLLDLDDQYSEERYESMLSFVNNILNGGSDDEDGNAEHVDWAVTITEKRSWVSSGGNRHVLLTLSRDLTVQERLILQLVLGSDPKKELYSLARIWEGSTAEPSLLFRPPDKVEQKRVAKHITPVIDIEDDLPF